MKSIGCVAVLAATAAWAAGAGGLDWKSPAAWKAQPAKPMRAATWKVPAVKGDKDDPECAVFYFGTGQGGSVDANIQRWMGQFEATTGAPKTTHEKVGDLPVTLVEVQGTFLWSATPMATEHEKRPDYRLLGAIVEGPQGPVFFKMTGPSKTVESARPEFLKMVRSIHRA